MMTSEHQ